MGMDSILLTTMVSVMCGGIIDINYQKACSSSVEATSIQSGIYDRIKIEEKKAADKAENKVKYYLGIQTVEVASAVMLGVGVLSGSNTLFKLGKGLYEENYYFETNSKNFKFGLSKDF